MFNSRGFTLIELIILLCVIGIVTFLAIPFVSYFLPSPVKDIHHKQETVLSLTPTTDPSISVDERNQSVGLPKMD